MKWTIAASALPLLATAILTAAPPPVQAPLPRVIPFAELVRQLGSEDYAEREAATKRLSSIALDPPSELLAATKSESPDIRSRALKIVHAAAMSRLRDCPEGSGSPKKGKSIFSLLRPPCGT